MSFHLHTPNPILVARMQRSEIRVPIRSSDSIAFHPRYDTSTS